MTDSSFASLCPTLLARKGGAKPAMRPQLGLPDKMDGQLAAANLEDLGWNDMGDVPEEGGTLANVVPLTSGSDTIEEDPASPVIEKQAPRDNPVRSRIEQIASKFEEPKRKPVSDSKASAQAKVDSGKRAAFTLRLDTERHLRLRLASTIRNCSAQQFVTEALDAMLDDMPEINDLAAQLQRN